VSPGRRHAAEAGVIVPRSGAPAAALPSARPRWTTLARIVGATGMLLITGLLFWLLTDGGFRVGAADVTIEGLTWTDAATVRQRITGLERSPNVFRVRASEIVSRLRELPAVASARATVTLPGSVTIHVTEREPLFAWTDRITTALVDREGVLLATVADEDLPDGLPVVEDGRELSEPFQAGDQLPADDLVVMRHLLALSPASLGSTADELRVRVDAADGYVLSSAGWQAVFGHYTASLHPIEMLPRQVQCLRWLLGTYERTLERAVLSASGDACGTFKEGDRRD
jgi:hypothetical protein